MADNAIDLTKIAALLKEMNISEDTTKEFVSICESWIKGERDKLNTEFQARLDRTKQVCVEEVEAHKSSLSRGVQMFLESKIDEIKKAAAKQQAIEESEAIKTLKRIQEMLGKNVDGAVSDQTLQAEHKKTAALTKELADLRESLTKEKAKTDKLHELAEKSMARQRTLEVQLKESHEAVQKATSALKESRDGDKGTLSEAKTKKATPKTAVRQKHDEHKQSSGDSAIDEIANSL